MATKARFQAIRGTRDLLPPDTALWNRVEQTARDVFRTFGFGEIRPPIFEPTELFARAVGGETDIVSKEMYTLEDYEASDLLEHRTALLTWKDREPSQTGPLGVGMLARFQPFFELCQLFFKLARQSFDRGLVPRTPENEAFLRVFEGEVQAFQGTIQSQTLEECRRAVNSLKERTRTFVLGDSLALRPEATASVCRAYIEHNMQQWPQPVKLYYMGPMFRRERPQKGRYRQFYQIGAEVLEAARPDSAKDAAKELAKDAAVDAEVIEMVMTFFSRLRLEGAQLEINSIGHAAHAAGGENVCRREYVEKLRADLRKAKDKLGADSQRRIETNPLRVLDSKLEHEQGIIESLPRIADHLCADCKAHYAELKRQLDLRGVPYKENWRLVRGLDYYMRTTFEITARGLGSQNAVCGGGRYDGLVELLGGPPAKGIGFAIGEDRLILSLQESAKAREAGKPESPAASRQSMDVYIAWTGANTYATALRAAKNLRSAGVRVELPPAEQKFGKALERASKLGSRFALILGENEVQSGEWTLKNLADGSQQKLDEPQLLKLLSERSSA
jgi:histidyl-tRNA synthetase